MYEIKNISGCLMLAGLYPGESKKVPLLTDDIKILYHKQLLNVRTIPNKVKSKDSNTLKDCEVLDTDGRN